MNSFLFLCHRMPTYNVPLEHCHCYRRFFNERQASASTPSTSSRTTAPLTPRTSTRSTKTHYVDGLYRFANYAREPTTENEELLNWLFFGPPDPGPAFTIRSRITMEEYGDKECEGREQNNLIWQPTFPRRKRNKRYVIKRQRWMPSWMIFWKICNCKYFSKHLPNVFK